MIRELARTGRCTFHGEFNDVDDCIIHPRGPRPDGPPIMIGSNGPRMLRLTMAHADSWNTWWSHIGNSPAGFTKLMAEVDAACHDVGRDPAEVERTCCVLVQLEGGAGRQMGNFPGERPEPISGSVAEIADKIAAFADAGAHHVQLVLDPITEDSIEFMGGVLEHLDA